MEIRSRRQPKPKEQRNTMNHITTTVKIATRPLIVRILIILIMVSLTGTTVAAKDLVIVDREALRSNLNKALEKLETTKAFISGLRKLRPRHKKRIFKKIKQTRSNIIASLIILDDAKTFIIKSPPLQVRKAPPPHQALSDSEFKKFVKEFNYISYVEPRLERLRELSQKDYLSVKQVTILVDKMEYADDKIDTVVILYSCIVDKKNFYKLYDHLMYKEDKKELKRRLNLK